MKTVVGKRRNSRRIWIPVLLVLLTAAGGGYFVWSQKNAASAQAQASQTTETTQTAQVRQGSITISIGGAGTLAASRERALRFPVSGTVAEVNVQVGDIVEEGQALARLAELDDLQAEVTAAQENLAAAQAALDALKASAASNLANARLAQADAEEALLKAKSGVITKDMARCDQQTTDAYYYEYTHAQDYLESLGDGGGNSDFYVNIIVPAKNTAARAYAKYAYCLGYADYEISASEANYTLAELNLQQAQADLEELVANGGIAPVELADAENSIAEAQLALEKAQDNLAGATMTAPFAGTVLSIEGEAGDSAGTAAFITIADLAHPLVNFSIDETDMEQLFIGEEALVTFDAVPNRIYQGKVIRINPELQSSDGYSVLTGVIELDLSQETGATTLPKGLNASVELIYASAENVILVPLQALRDLGDGTHSVFVMENGKPRLRVVEVGLQDAAYAEIKSGVNLGDVVTTGVVEIN